EMRCWLLRSNFGSALPLLPERLPEDRLERRRQREANSRLSLWRRIWRDAGSAARRFGNGARAGICELRLYPIVSAGASQSAPASIAPCGCISAHGRIFHALADAYLCSVPCASLGINPMAANFPPAKSVALVTEGCFRIRWPALSNSP